MCDVCCESYNKSNRAPVSCPFCDFKACVTCHERYLCETAEDAHCMSCRKGWTRETLVTNFTQKFVSKTYKARREELLFEREKSLMPATQPYVEIEKEIRSLNPIINRTRAELERAWEKYNRISNQATSVLAVELGLPSDFRARVKRHELASEQLKIVNCLREDIAHIEWVQNALTNHLTGGSVEHEKRQFVRACPHTDCKGFLSSAWKCGLCENWACPTCHEVKGLERDAPHVCDPNSVATAMLLAKDSRNCPKCASMIFKIDGCFAKDTPILLWNCKMKMSQDIQVGDVLIGDDGAPRVVTETCTGRDEMYRIRQRTGIDYTVNSHHKLVLKYTGEKEIYKFGNDAWKIRWFHRETKCSKTKQFETLRDAQKFRETLNMNSEIEMLVSDYILLKESTKKHLHGFKSAGIDWPSQEVGLDPYIMGLWIGDGINNGLDFASNDPEIQAYLYEWCRDYDAELVHTDAYRFRIRRRGTYWKTDAVGQGECTGCSKKPAWICSQEFEDYTPPLKRSSDHPFKKWMDKHIPDEYLMNDRTCRLELLAGLIDTDGCVTNGGKRASIIQSKKNIAEKIELLSRSLGFTTSFRTVERKQVVLPNCEPKDFGDHYIVNISGERLSEVPTRIARKKCVDSNPNKDWQRTSIRVEPCGSGTYYGWSVSGNKRFVGTDLTVLRNCDQMYCTQCHTAFSWRTGRVETGAIHNPHYYEYMRVHGGGLPRAAGDVPCGGFPQWGTLARLVSRTDVRYIVIANAHMLWGHLQWMLPRYGVNINEDNRDLRIKLMIGDSSEDDFKKKIQQREKARQRKTDIRQVIEMIRAVLVDLFQDFERTHDTTVLYESLNELRGHYNDTLDKISWRYGKCAVPRLGNNFMV